MKISTKGRYALQMLLDLAEHEGCVALKDVAARQDISKKYLEQIIPMLGCADLLHANRGAQGGYSLARKPEEITVGQVLRLTEGGICPVDCAKDHGCECERSEECLTLPVWQGLYRVIAEYLDGITLQDILDQRRERENEA